MLYLRKRDTVEATVNNTDEPINVPQNDDGSVVHTAEPGEAIVTHENGIELSFPKVYDAASFDRLFEAPRERAAETTPGVPTSTTISTDGETTMTQVDQAGTVTQTTVPNGDTPPAA